MLNYNFKYADTILLGKLVAIVGAGTLVASFISEQAALFTCLILMFAGVVSVQMHLYRERQRDDDLRMQHLQALQFLYSRIPFRAPLPPLTGWSASPRLANTLYTLIHEVQPRTVVEFGSGASTLVMAYALEQVGQGRILSLDHDAAYGAKTNATLAKHGLTAFAEVHHAPLTAVDLPDGTWQWYDPATFDGADEVDLVVIDGPPVKTQRLARYPALPLLADRLSDRAVLVLDDAARDDEQQIVDRWCAAFPGFVREFTDEAKGIAVLRRQPTPREVPTPQLATAKSI